MTKLEGCGKAAPDLGERALVVTLPLCPRRSTRRLAREHAMPAEDRGVAVELEAGEANPVYPL